MVTLSLQLVILHCVNVKDKAVGVCTRAQFPPPNSHIITRYLIYLPLSVISERPIKQSVQQ